MFLNQGSHRGDAQKNAARGRRKASGDAAQLAVPGSAWVDVPVGAWKQCPASVRSLGRSRATWPGRRAMLPRSPATSQSVGRRKAFLDSPRNDLFHADKTWQRRRAMLPRSLTTSQSVGRRRAWSTLAEPGNSTESTSPPSTLAAHEIRSLPAFATQSLVDAGRAWHFDRFDLPTLNAGHT